MIQFFKMRIKNPVLWTMIFGFSSLIASAQINISQDENYIYVQEPTEPMTIVNGDSVIRSVQYFDGLGRPKQNIQIKATPGGKDIVTKIEYDDFGRQTKDFLPIPVSQQPNGNFIDPSSINGAYYQQNYGQSVWYSEKTIESSPLNRVLKQAAPGDAWAKGGGHEIEFGYQLNKATEVKIYKLSAGDVISQNGYYPKNTLYKTITKDENGNAIHEFKDKQGKVILKRSFVTEYAESEKPDPNPPTSANKKADTYYVYDVYGNLVAVIPPLAAEKYSINNTTRDNLCYLYHYDDRNRLIEKKLPSKGWEYMVYDKQNRLVATQDANLRADNKWLFTKYDKFGRLAYTGVYLSSDNRDSIQNIVNSKNENSVERTNSGVNKNGITLYYTTENSFPSNFSEVLTINYYDNYENFKDYQVNIPNVVYQHQIRMGGSSSDQSLKGMLTANFLNVISTDSWEQIYSFYDLLSRPVRTHKITHYYGGYTIVDNELKFKGMPEKTKTSHKKDESSEAVIIEDSFTYDSMLRLTLHTQSLNNSSVKNLISKNVYDSIGQLKNKKVGGIQSGNDRWQSIDYKYNIRGWLTDINNIGWVLAGKNALPPSEGDGLFAFKINYNQLNNNGSQYVSSLYNGNISQTLWRTSEDNIVKGYVYNYDELNRLLNAKYYKQDNNPYKNAYYESLSYDVNGNIKSLYRTTGDAYGNSIEMDDLSYIYKDEQGNSNLLLNVTDTVSSQNAGGFKDGNTNPALNDYEYDANGNMKSDKNKGITHITYNYLNLPVKINFSPTVNNGSTITYTYNALGQKLSKFVDSTPLDNKVKLVEYFDGFQYTGGQLNFFPTPEGYVNVTLGSTGNRIFNYVFNYTDHLGNVRLSYTKDMWTGQLKIMEENHYYPFGMKHEINTSPIVLTLKPTPEPDIARPGYTVRTEYQYKYNGKEWQDELGLDWYAMDMRMYDPAIARWVVQDPVIHFYQSPYNSYDGNPVFWADPSGADTVNIGYDREVDSDSISGSVRWSGGLDTLGGGSENEPPKGYNGNTYTDETGHYTKWEGQDNSYVKDGATSQVYDSNHQEYYGVAEVTGSARGQSSNSSSSTHTQGRDLVTTTSTVRNESPAIINNFALKVYQASDVADSQAGMLNIDKSTNLSDGSMALSGQLNTPFSQTAFSMGSNGLGASGSLSVFGIGLGTSYDNSGVTITGFKSAGGTTNNSFNVQIKPIGMLIITAGIIFAPQVVTFPVLLGF